MTDPAPGIATEPSWRLGLWLLVVACTAFGLTEGVDLLGPLTGGVDGLPRSLLFVRGLMWSLGGPILGVGLAGLAIAFVDPVRVRRMALLAGAGGSVATGMVLSMNIVLSLLGSGDLDYIWDARSITLVLFRASFCAWALGTFASRGVKGPPPPPWLAWMLVLGLVAPLGAQVMGLADWMLYEVSMGAGTAGLVFAGLVGGGQFGLALVVFACVVVVGRHMRSVYLWPTLVFLSLASLWLITAVMPKELQEAQTVLWSVGYGVQFGVLAGAMAVEALPGLRPTDPYAQPDEVASAA